MTETEELAKYNVGEKSTPGRENCMFKGPRNERMWQKGHRRGVGSIKKDIEEKKKIIVDTQLLLN